MGDATIARMAQSEYGDELMERFVEYATEAVWT